MSAASQLSVSSCRVMNVANAIHGVSVLVDARDNLVINNTEDGRVVAVVGLTDTVIVQTPQITLVCPITEAERIKELVAEVTAKLGGGYA
jgi:mannose-1-phosphate guanylyltransferase